MNKKIKKILPFAIAASIVMTGCDNKSNKEEIIPDTNPDSGDNDNNKEQVLLQEAKLSAIKSLESTKLYNEYKDDAAVKKFFTVATANINKETSLDGVKNVLKKELNNLKSSIELAQKKSALIENAQLIKLSDEDKNNIVSKYDEETFNWANNNINEKLDAYTESAKSILSNEQYEEFINNNVINESILSEVKNGCFEHYYTLQLTGNITPESTDNTDEDFAMLLQHKQYKEELNAQLNKLKSLIDANRNQSVINHAIDSGARELNEHLKYNIKNLYHAQVKKINEVNEITLPLEWKELDKEGYDLYNEKLNEEKQLLLLEIDNAKTARYVELMEVPSYSYTEFIENVSNMVNKCVLTLTLEDGYNQKEVKENSNIITVINNSKNAFEKRLQSIESQDSINLDDFKDVLDEQRNVLNNEIDSIIKPYIEQKINELNQINLTDDEIKDKSSESIEAANKELDRLRQASIDKINDCNKNIEQINSITLDKTSALNLLVDKNTQDLITKKKAALTKLNETVESIDQEQITYWGALDSFKKAIKEAKSSINEATLDNIDAISDEKISSIKTLGEFLIKKSVYYSAFSDPSTMFESKGWSNECRKYDSDFNKYVTEKCEDYRTQVQNASNLEDLGSIPDLNEFFNGLLDEYLPIIYSQLDNQINSIENFDKFMNDEKIKNIIDTAKEDLREKGPSYIDENNKTVVIIDSTVNKISELVNSSDKIVTLLKEKLSSLDRYNKYQNNPDIKGIVDTEIKNIEENGETNFDVDGCVSKVESQIEEISGAETELLTEFGRVYSMQADWMGHEETKFAKKFQSLQMDVLLNHSYTLEELNSFDLESKLDSFKEEIRNEYKEQLSNGLSEIERYNEYQNNPDIKGIVDTEIKNIEENGETNFDVDGCVEQVKNKISELDKTQE